MKLFKSILSIVLVLCLASCTAVTAFASTGDAVAAGSGIMAEFVANAYDTSVISRMIGRAGASTPKGSKGISFELMLKDKLNLEGIFNSAEKVVLSQSSTDPVADLVVYNKGQIARQIQCKDGTSPSQIAKILNSIEDGKYFDVYATTECAELCNTAAGEKLVVDSGISTSHTKRVGEKFLGITSLETLKGAVGKAGTVGASIGAVISSVESMIRGDDLSHTVSNVVTDTSIATITSVLCPLSEAGMISLLSALGASSVVAAASGTVIAFVVPTTVGWCLYTFVEKTDFQETLAALVDKGCDYAVNCFETVSAYVFALEIEAKVNEVSNYLGTVAKGGVNQSKQILSQCSSVVESGYDAVRDHIRNAF